MVEAACGKRACENLLMLVWRRTVCMQTIKETIVTGSRSGMEKPDLASSRAASRAAVAGMFVRRERWGVSGRGWLALALVVVVVVWFGFANIYRFLAVADPVKANTLVVEGWVHPYAVRLAASEFRNGRYDRIFTTGGPVVGLGGYVNDYQTSASVGAGLLRKMGVPQNMVQMVPSHVNGRDRTYSSALALRDWFREHNMQVTSMNVVTESTHARRTRMLFQKAFGGQVAIGVIGVPSPDYDPKNWWRYSEGVRDVIDESVAYLYAIVFVDFLEPRR